MDQSWISIDCGTNVGPRDKNSYEFNLGIFAGPTSSPYGSPDGLVGWGRSKSAQSRLKLEARRNGGGADGGVS